MEEDKRLEADFEDIEETVETEEFDLIVLEDEELGENIELVIVDSVEESGVSYLLVVPLQEFDEECPNASIIKEFKDERGEFVYEIVEDDEEFERVSVLFADEQ